ncbi:hypothetical protein LPJ66_007241 [Kickxella alabastrina]|uniref:Uncharacterized protein n=1 Tax=Kickxella alabastrina TaxID=61397 RepID=A0ACC1I9M9_9FUNG|nr:hypothetical protein LPJ66_007241 [Kickxella alabastrina]
MDPYFSREYNVPVSSYSRQIAKTITWDIDMDEVLKGRGLLAAQRRLSTEAVYPNVHTLIFTIHSASSRYAIDYIFVRNQFAKLVKFFNRTAPNTKHMSLRNKALSLFGSSEMVIFINLLVSDLVNELKGFYIRDGETVIPSHMFLTSAPRLTHIRFEYSRNYRPFFQLVHRKALTLEDVMLFA